MKIKIFVLGVIISLTASCRWYVVKETKEKFTSCYNGKYTGLDTLINTHGYYAMNKIFTYKNGVKSISQIYCMFYDDGFYIDSYFPQWGGGYYGRYIVEHDTIKAQFLYNPKASPNAGIYEVWYKIIDKNRILWLYCKSWEKMTNEDIEKFRAKNLYVIDTANFVPLDELPNTDRFWIKRHEFFWCDKEKYKEFKEKIKKETITEYNDAKHR
jgi:hypothetical protein